MVPRRRRGGGRPGVLTTLLPFIALSTIGPARWAAPCGPLITGGDVGQELDVGNFGPSAGGRSGRVQHRRGKSGGPSSLSQFGHAIGCVKHRCGPHGRAGRHGRRLTAAQPAIEVVSETSGGTELSTADSVSKVTRFYENALKDGGWRVVSTAKTAAKTTIVAMRGRNGVGILISSAVPAWHIDALSYARAHDLPSDLAPAREPAGQNGRCAQPDDPNWMGTLMVCVAAHARARRARSCQTVSLVLWTARASHPPAGPGASVAVPGGSAGSGRHEPAGVGDGQCVVPGQAPPPRCRRARTMPR